MKNMKRTTKILIIVTAVLFAVSGGAAYYSLNVNKDSKVAYIYQNGELLYQIDLETVVQSYTIEIVSDDGDVNVVCVRKGEIGMLSADCPDKLCVKTGFIGDGVLPVVCVPNGITIIVKSDGGKVDAQT